jgi:hypothetical protein
MSALAGAIAASLAVAHPVAANPVDDLLPGHWLEAPDSRLDAHDPEDDPALNPNWPLEAPWHGVEGLRGIMDDWSSAAYDTRRDRLVVWGGGHSGYAGNEVYAFDVNTLEWERLTNPSVDVDYNGTTLYADGQPRARETYNYLQYLPAFDQMMSFGGGNLYPCCVYTAETAAFDFATRTWNTTRFAPRPEEGDPFSSIAAIDGVTGHAWFIGGGDNHLVEFDPVANAWTTHAAYYMLLYRNGTIDPVRRKFVWFGWHGDTTAFDIETPELPPAVQPTGGDREIEGVAFPGVAWDPVRRRIVAWGEGSDVYALDTATWVWTRISADPANTVVPTAPNIDGTNGRFRYVASKDVFVLVNNVDENVFFYRMPLTDSDADGLFDQEDNCRHDANGPELPDGGGRTQLDTDGDGIGNACDADIALPNDCRVNFTDLAAVNQAFLTRPGRPRWNPDADFNGDRRVNDLDVALVEARFYADYRADNPSGIPNACSD